MTSLLSSSGEQQASPQVILDLLDAMHHFLPKSWANDVTEHAVHKICHLKTVILPAVNYGLGFGTNSGLGAARPAGSLRVG